MNSLYTRDFGRLRRRAAAVLRRFSSLLPHSPPQRKDELVRRVAGLLREGAAVVTSPCARDASTRKLRKWESGLCAAQCVPKPAFPLSFAVFEAVYERAQALWAQGDPLNQALHITAWAGTGGADLELYPWPNELALQDYYFAPDTKVFFEEPVGNSKLVPAAEAAHLRSLRERYLGETRGLPNLYSPDGIPVTDGELSGRVFLRDALPYEDERGLWPLPGE